MKLLPIILAAIGMPLFADSGVSFGNATLFNDGWSFVRHDSLAGIEKVSAKKWQEVDLPHDWSVLAQASPTLASCTGYYPGGIGWYRKEFDMTSEQLTQCNYIYFEGIYNRSTVWLNGHELGYRPSGFASFCYDMTPYLKEGTNELMVRADHSRYADSRWYTGSGIYRDVWMVTAPETHLSQWGTGYVCTSLTRGSATLQVEVSVDNLDKTPGAQIRIECVDAAGKTVAGSTVKPKSAKSLANLRIANPRRWDLRDPYLYTLKVTLTDRKGSRLDGTEVRAGLRTLKFDPDRGFALNGEWMKVKGVCLHHDAGTLGAAVPEDVWRRRLVRLKGIGVNAIRCSHNPQAPVLYDLCDELGLLMMDEASDEWEFPKRKWVEGWNVGTPSFDGTYDFFEEWIDRDVTDMVRRDRNHPSIIMWSIGNEVDYPNDPYSHPILNGKDEAFSQPIFGGYDPSRPNAERIGKIAKRLAACVRSVDTSRPVTGALAGVVMSNETEYPESVDIVGYNYTEKRYDEDHATYPKRVIYGSENGRGYDAWKAVRDRDFIFGQFIWTGTDYLGESGRWPSRGLHTGLLDFASMPKPRGHFRAAIWCDQPVCYLGTYPVAMARSGSRGPVLSQDAPDIWNYTEGDTIRVVCYTNGAAAQLTLNGTKVGEQKPFDDNTGIIYWDIPYQPGVLSAEALDANGNAISSYKVETSGRPYALRARLDDVEGCNTVHHVLLEVVDEEGRVVKLADNNITCLVEGDGKLLGLENSDNSDMGDYTDNRQRVFMGQLLAYVQSTGTDPIRVTFTSPLLKPVTIDI